MKAKIIIIATLFAHMAIGCNEDETSNANSDNQEESEGLIKFSPHSTTAGNILPTFPGMPFEGKLNNVGAALMHNNLFYLFYNDFVGGWPPKDVNIGYATSENLGSWARNEQVTLSGDMVSFLNGTTEHPLIGSIITESDGSIVLYFDVIKSGAGIGIGRASAPSFDGPWTVDPDLVLAPDEGSWDTHGITSNHVIKTNGEYRMYYSVFMSEAVNPEMAIAMATSSDGKVWEKYNDPATTSNEFKHSDPIFLKGTEGSWDSYKVEAPKVIQVEEGFVMTYRSDDGNITWGSNSGIGMATSPDGVAWSRIQDGAVIHEDDIDGWETIWGSALLYHENTFYLFVETDGPPIFGTRINVLSYSGSFDQ